MLLIQKDRVPFGGALSKESILAVGVPPSLLQAALLRGYHREFHRCPKGPDTACKLARDFSGTRVYLPVEPTESHPIALSVGIDAARLIGARFGGDDLELPMHKSRAQRRRDREEILEDVQYLAGHSNPRTTQIYDRRRRRVTRKIVERISI